MTAHLLAVAASRHSPGGELWLAVALLALCVAGLLGWLRRRL